MLSNLSYCDVCYIYKNFIIPESTLVSFSQSMALLVASWLSQSAIIPLAMFGLGSNIFFMPFLKRRWVV
jgi:hypothetical protein